MRMKFTVAVLAAATLGLAACDVEQTEEAELPEVEVTGGNMPEYNVDTADVDVDAGTTTKTVEVPTLDVDVEEADASEAETTGQ